MTQIKVLNFQNQPTFFDIVKEWDLIHVLILSGDEIVTIYYTDGTEERIDSSNCRLMDFYDGEYDIDHTDLCNWMKRTETYGFLYGYKYD